MLKYYEYLLRIRSLLREQLRDRRSSPTSRRSRSISTRRCGSTTRRSPRGSRRRARRRPAAAPRDRYYIHKTRPFFVGGRIYYEVTFYRAVNKVSKFDRIIAFTDIDMTDKYAAMLTLQRDSIDVLDQTMPITIIRDWEVSIRPCEFDNFARLLGVSTQDVRTSSAEYRYLMQGLTSGSGSLLDLIDMTDDEYAATKAAGTAGVAKPQIFPVLDEARRIVRSAAAGSQRPALPHAADAQPDHQGAVQLRSSAVVCPG